MKLNLGCGSQIVAGWVNVDWPSISPPFLHSGEAPPELMTFDLREPWPLPTSSARHGALHHVLDLMTPGECIHVLREANRVLTEGLRISGFDPVLAAGAFDARDERWFSERFETVPNETRQDHLTRALTCNGARRQVLTSSAVQTMALAAGWEETTTRTYGDSDGEELSALDSRPEESWYVECW